MSKLHVLEIGLNLEGREKKRRIDQNHILGLRGDVKDYSPTFEPARSVITIKRRFHKDKKLVIILDGEQHCFSVESYVDPETNETKAYFTRIFGGLKESQEFNKKVASKTKAERKEKQQFNFLYPLIAFSIMLGAVLIMQLLIARGLKIV